MEQPKKLGVTSVEAAALLISNGSTDDPVLATQMAEGKVLDEDALLRAHFRRQMGFDFDLEIKDNRFVLTDLETGNKSSCFYAKDDEKTIKRLVRACLRLKKLHETRKKI